MEFLQNESNIPGSEDMQCPGMHTSGGQSWVIRMTHCACNRPQSPALKPFSQCPRKNDEESTTAAEYKTMPNIGLHCSPNLDYTWVIDHSVLHQELLNQQSNKYNFVDQPYIHMVRVRIIILQGFHPVNYLRQNIIH